MTPSGTACGGILASCTSLSVTVEPAATSRLATTTVTRSDESLAVTADSEAKTTTPASTAATPRRCQRMRLMIFSEVHTPDNGRQRADPSVVPRSRDDGSPCGKAQAAEVVDELDGFDGFESDVDVDFSLPDDFSVPDDFSELVVALAAAVLALVRLSVA